MKHTENKYKMGIPKSNKIKNHANVTGLNTLIKQQMVRVIREIQPYAVYKRHTLDSKAHVG